MSSKVIEGIFYTEDHEWIKLDGNKAYIGITDYAQHSLGDIVYVELPSEGDEFDSEDEVANIESVKTAAPLFTPVPGVVVEVNEALEGEAELLNSDPYETFIVALEIDDSARADIEALLSAEDYAKIVEE